MESEAQVSVLGSIAGGLWWVIENIGLAFYNTAWAILNPSQWLGWIGGLETTEDKEALMRFAYYGASVEFFFFLLTAFLIALAIGVARPRAMWGMVIGLETFANVVGRFAAWAGLLMVLQQILIVMLQRFFLVSQISIGPFGYTFTKDLSWFGEELKLYNAIVVCLCCAYTFVQGGHVRVDLVYSVVRHRTKKIIDMAGSILFMMPAMVLIWLYSWFFMWRHLITPKISASEPFERIMLKARAVRWNVETVGFSPQGFNGYFLFKILICMFVAMVFLQAVAFFFRSFQEWREGEESAGKYHDKDVLGDEDAERVAEIH